MTHQSIQHSSQTAMEAVHMQPIQDAQLQKKQQKTSLAQTMEKDLGVKKGDLATTVSPSSKVDKYDPYRMTTNLENLDKKLGEKRKKQIS